jgi:hypothetical protein
MRTRGLALFLTVAAGAATAHADILVTRDGARVVTRGPWRVEGRRVIFTQPNGTLAALRTDEVDLDQSASVTAQASQAAKESARPAAPPVGEPVLTLTERDIPPVGENGETEEAPADEQKPAANAVPLEVASWDRLEMPNGDGIEIFGTVRNIGKANIVAPGITVAVYGEEGGLLANSDASVNQSSIAPGTSANFRAPFPGLTDFAAIKFSFSGRGYETAQPAPVEDTAVDVASEATTTEEPAPEPPPAR